MEQVQFKSQALSLVEALISSSFDKDEDAKRTICDSLSAFGKKQPDLVLNTIHIFLSKHAKIDQLHRLLLLNCLKLVVDNSESIAVEVAKKIIVLVGEDLTNSKKLSKECQNAASDLLASLGKHHLIEVVEELLKKFVPGILAHIYVIQTLGQLAIYNISGMMNHINYVLATTVSQISLAKSDNLKAVFAICLSNFSDCVCELYSNPELSKDLPKGAFAQQFSIAFNILFSGWLTSKNAKVQCAVIQALGKICLLLPQNELQDVASKLVPALLGQYRRHSQEALVITTAICNVIRALTNHESHILESTFDMLTANLHNQICSMPDEASPIVTKNYNEVLRCFGILATYSSTNLVSMILTRVDARDEKVRSGNILILKHLINSNPTQMKENQDLVITGFQKYLYDSSNRVKSNLAKLVITMGTHGFLHREGGKEYIKFILRQCTLSTYDIPGKVPQLIPNQQLRDMCCDILLLLTTTVTDAEQILWPYLFEFVTDGNFTNALGVIIRSLSVLAQNKKELMKKDEKDNNADSYTKPLLDFEETQNISQPTSIISRLLVMLEKPIQKQMHTDAFLILLQHLGSSFHKRIPGLFDKKIPLLIDYLEDNQSKVSEWNQDEWHSLILEFLTSILDEVGDEEWMCSLAQSITSQWPLYEFLPEYKSFAYKSLGVVLQKINNKDFVISYLALLFMSINHAIPIEREGAAMCIGRCAFIHLDAVLDKLNEFITINISKKESSYFNMFKSERSLIELEQCKGYAALCCGHIAYYAPADLLSSRLEMNIIKSIRDLSKHLKTNAIRIEWVTAVHLIAQSLVPERFSSLPNQPRYVFAAREDLISKLLDYLKDDNDKATELKISILRACAALVKLDPPMSGEDVASTTKQSLTYIVPLYKSSPDDDPTLIVACTRSLNNLLEEILKKRPNSNGLLTIFKDLEIYLISNIDYERIAAIRITRYLLEKFYEIVVVSDAANVLANTGLLIARILPCCCDPLTTIRMEALLSIKQLLNVMNKHHDSSSEIKSDRDTRLDRIGEKLLSNNPEDVDEAVDELTKMLCSKLPSDLLLYRVGSLTSCLFDALTWPQASSVHGACIVLAHIMESRGAMFGGQVPDIVSALIKKITILFDNNRTQDLKDSVLNLLCLLSHHHLKSTVNALLNHPLPFTNVILSCWYCIGHDKSSESVFDYLLEQLDRSLPYDEVLKKKGKPKFGSSKTATKSSLSVSCALYEVLQSLLSNQIELNRTVHKYRYKLITVAMIRVGTMYDIQTPPKLKIDPYKQAVDLLRAALISLCLTKLTFDLDQAGLWDILYTKDGFATLSTAVGCIVRELSKHKPDDITHIVSYLNNYLTSIYEMQRITAVAFFVQLVHECSSHDEILLEIAMNNLRSRLVDSNNYIRQLSIVGLSNIVHTSQDQIDRYSTSVLSAMMTGMDDNDDPDHSISLAAMSGLAMFLNKAEKVNIHSMFVNICLRARPCFEREDPRVRSAAFELFGALAKFANDDLQTAFAEQAHSNFISLLLHLNDENDQVKTSCKATLKEISRHIGSEAIDELFQKVLPGDAQLHYGEFTNNLTKLMVSNFPDKINFYLMECVSFFKSSWPIIRANAAMLSGFIMRNVGDDFRATINVEHICAALIQLLKDSSPSVRSRTAESISLLYSY